MRLCMWKCLCLCLCMRMCVSVCINICVSTAGVVGACDVARSWCPCIFARGELACLHTRSVCHAQLRAVADPNPAGRANVHTLLPHVLRNLLRVPRGCGSRTAALTTPRLGKRQTTLQPTGAWCPKLGGWLGSPAQARPQRPNTGGLNFVVTCPSGLTWRTRKLIHSISRRFSMVLLSVRRGVLSPQCQKILKVPCKVRNHRQCLADDVLVGLTENTWETHRRLMDSKRFAMELEVAPGVFTAPGWHLCLSYEEKVREAAMDLIRMQYLPLAEALDRVRNGQEHQMIHWVQLFMQPGKQRAISAPASSTSSSSSAKRVSGSSFQQPAFRRQSAHE